MPVVKYFKKYGIKVSSGRKQKTILTTVDGTPIITANGMEFEMNPGPDQNVLGTTDGKVIETAHGKKIELRIKN